MIKQYSAWGSEMNAHIWNRLKSSKGIEAYLRIVHVSIIGLLLIPTVSTGQIDISGG